MFTTPDIIQEKTNAALNGDGEAMGVLFEWYRPRLYAHALRICGNTPLAQDAVQDAFIAAFTHLHALRDASHFYPWLKKILVHQCYRLVNREKKSEAVEPHLRNDQLLHNSIDAHFDNISNAQRMHEVLRYLSDELRSVVMLRYFSSFNSYAEIATTLDVPVGTVRSRLSAAREKLTALFALSDDAGNHALKESQHWSGWYHHLWTNMHSDLQSRNDFFNHLHPALNIRFTSGKTGKGRQLIEKEITDDLIYGSSVAVKEVASSGNISLVEADNINHPDYHDRCAPSMVLVLFRNKDVVETAHIFDSPRP